MNLPLDWQTTTMKFSRRRLKSGLVVIKIFEISPRGLGWTQMTKQEIADYLKTNNPEGTNNDGSNS